MTCPLGIRRHASARRRPPELSLFQRKISRGKYTPGSISSGTGDSSNLRADHHRSTIPVQILLVLACLRKDETFAELIAGFGINTATAWRYLTGTVALLAARAPKLR